MYSAIFLDDKSKKILFKKYKVPNGWKAYGDHMTIKMGKLTSDMVQWKGTKYILTINSIGVSESNIAFGVDTDLSFNKNPHITFAVDMGKGKPFDSNKITKWKSITPFKVTGILSEK